MRRSPVWLMAALAGAPVLLAGCGSWQQARFQRDLDTVFLLPAGAGLSATTANGSVGLAEGARDDVLVRAHIRATTQERADAVEITGAAEGGWLEIRAVWPEARLSNEGVSFEIEAPGGRAVRASTGNGSVTVTGFAGGATLETSNGAVTVDRHDGPLDLETSNGAIAVIGATSSVDATTSNGRVRVELADSGVGPVEIETSNGGVTLIVGPGFAGRIEADTSNGSVSAFGTRVGAVSGSKTHKSVQIGEGGEASTVSTSNGSVEIESRG